MMNMTLLMLLFFVIFSVDGVVVIVVVFVSVVVEKSAICRPLSLPYILNTLTTTTLLLSQGCVRRTNTEHQQSSMFEVSQTTILKSTFHPQTFDRDSSSPNSPKIVWIFKSHEILPKLCEIIQQMWIFKPHFFIEKVKTTTGDMKFFSGPKS